MANKYLRCPLGVQGMTMERDPVKGHLLILLSLEEYANPREVCVKVTFADGTVERFPAVQVVECLAVILPETEKARGRIVGFGFERAAT